MRRKSSSALLADGRAEAAGSLESGAWDLSRPPTTASPSSARRTTKYHDEEESGGSGGNNAEPTEPAAAAEPADDGQLAEERKSLRSGARRASRVTDHHSRERERQLPPENLVGHTSGVCSVIADDDRYIVSSSMDRSVKVWSRASFACLHTLFGHRDNVSCVALNMRWLVSGSHDTTLRVYSCVDGFRLLHALSGHAAHVTKVLLPAAQPQQILSCSDDASVRVWSGERGVCLVVLRGHASRVTCMHTDGERVCTGAADSAVMFWDLPTLSVVSRAADSRRRGQRRPLESESELRAARAFHVHTATVQALVASRSVDGTLVLSGSTDGTIQIFNFETAEYVGRLDHVHSPVYSLCALPNGELLCSTGDGRLLHFSDLFRHPLVKSELRLAAQWISMLQLRGRTVACSSEDLLYVVDAEQLAVLAVIESNHGFVNSVSWLHATALLSGGQDNVVKVWRLT
ncbi:hypothetical protein PybrP1_005763 [[Pythium] brassicae (nom. inval.)]|nr:hypothetical protein PybrP1_005763 [[Pythium] brassicae (nom. inval.)]